MTNNDGKQCTELNYEGLWIFGGKDYFELLAQMNGCHTREEGIDLIFFGSEHISPSLSESGAYFEGEAPERFKIEVTTF